MELNTKFQQRTSSITNIDDIVDFYSIIVNLIMKPSTSEIWIPTRIHTGNMESNKDPYWKSGFLQGSIFCSLIWNSVPGKKPLWNSFLEKFLQIWKNLDMRFTSQILNFCLNLKFLMIV